VEAAWLPLGQAQLVLHELWEREIPVVLAEDFTSHFRGAAREPMAWLYVMEPRLPEAEAVITEILGHPPTHHHR
jgi:hypothetical protein